MDTAAKNKSSFLLFLFLILLSEVTGFYLFDESINYNESLGYGVQIPGSVKIPGRAITSFIPAKILPPINVTRVLTTCHDGQTSVSVKVYEGDSSVREREREQQCVKYYESKCEGIHYYVDEIPNASRMKVWYCGGYDVMCHSFIGSYELFGSVELHQITPAPRGLPQIEVTFALRDFKLHVTVTDKSTMKSNSTSFMYGYRRRSHLYNLSMSVLTAATVDWKIGEADPTMYKATRNYIHPDGVCLYKTRSGDLVQK